MSKVARTAVIPALLVVTGTLVGCGAGQQARDARGRPLISDAERALASIQVQNVFSKHAYYHEAGKHRAEMEDIWVRKDGEYAATASWKQPMGMNVGYEAIWKFYVINKEAALARNLEDISRIDPSIRNSPENLGVGGEWASHTQSTPIIEIAGDGKTAKGIWESPGLHFSAEIRGGRISKRGGWFWEKYAADFVKEEGEWKIWHLAMYYENTPPGWNADNGTYEAIPRGGPGGPGSSGGPQAVGKVAAELAPQTETVQMYSADNPNPYKPWSPTKVPAIEPRFPEAYYTFSETFSY
ncbi:MAG: nuclear transport factor 2 family protein [Gammaproteobacteria bacterium]|nr:nuclear transport factor 2 family protein [Gammaproteobacteria bacterium]